MSRDSEFGIAHGGNEISEAELVRLWWSFLGEGSTWQCGSNYGAVTNDVLFLTRSVFFPSLKLLKLLATFGKLFTFLNAIAGRKV